MMTSFPYRLLAAMFFLPLASPGPLLAAEPAATDPEQGGIEDHAYRDPYFGLALQLPARWDEAMAGPPPSASGRYVLETVQQPGRDGAMIQISAQDMFFATPPWPGAEAFIRDLKASMASIDGMAIEGDATRFEAGGHAFWRLDFNGAGLYRSVVAAEARCHILSFSVLAKDPKQRDVLAGDLRKLALGAETGAPVCIGDYVLAEPPVLRVDPPPSPNGYRPVPVRIVIGEDGGVRHVHVIDATPDRKQAIEEALAQWRFNPPISDGKPAEIETGLLLDAAKAGAATQPAAR